MNLSLPSKTDCSFLFISSGKLSFNDSSNFLNMSLDSIVETFTEENLIHAEKSGESWELFFQKKNSFVPFDSSKRQ